MLKQKINVRKNFSKVTLCSGDTAIKLKYLLAYIFTVQLVYIHVFHSSGISSSCIIHDPHSVMSQTVHVIQPHYLHILRLYLIFREL